MFFVLLTRLQQLHTLWPALILNVCLGRAVTNYEAKQLEFVSQLAGRSSALRKQTGNVSLNFQFCLFDNICRSTIHLTSK